MSLKLLTNDEGELNGNEVLHFVIFLTQLRRLDDDNSSQVLGLNVNVEIIKKSLKLVHDAWRD